MSNYTKFRVIKIIDEYSLVINGGANEDLSQGDKIEIFLEGDELVDPYNDNETLGTLDFIKETLVVTELHLKFSVCEKLKKVKSYTPSPLETNLASALSTFTSFTKGKTTEKTVRVKLNINEEDMTGRVTGDKTILVGDTARVGFNN